jgi:hypothetical protein
MDLSLSGLKRVLCNLTAQMISSLLLFCWDFWSPYYCSFATVSSKLSDGTCPGGFQVRFGSDSKWPEGEACIRFAETVPGSPEGCTGPDCQGRVFDHARTKLRVRRAMVY